MNVADSVAVATPGASLIKTIFEPNLTDREIAICKLLYQGKTREEICTILEIGNHIIRDCRNATRRKIGISVREIP
jgi:DNA-binding NarL/FixJ family response regulator